MTDVYGSGMTRVRVLLIVGWAIAAMAGPVLHLIAIATTDEVGWHWPFGLLAFAPAAALILIRRPGNRVGLVLAVGATAAGVIFVASWASATATGAQAAVTLEHLSDAAAFATFWAMVTLLFLFPTGRGIGRRWTTLHTVFSVSFLGLVLPLRFIRPGPMEASGLTNPYGVPLDWLPGFLDAAFVLLPLAAFSGVISLGVRFRRSTGVERAQLKVFLFGAVLMIGLVTTLTVPENTHVAVDAIVPALVVLGFWGLPTAIVAAVLRYRLYDIDRLASRAVTYLIVVILLGAGYAGTIVALQSLLPFEGALPVAASTLAAASASLPLVRFVQREVDRRFFRSRYDAQEVVADLTTVLRSHVDLPMIAGLLADVVETTFEPAHMSLWIPDDATSPQRRAMLGG